MTTKEIWFGVVRLDAFGPEYSAGLDVHSCERRVHVDRELQ